jgi:predicted nucleic acid-binding Zn ribbon protein
MLIMRRNEAESVGMLIRKFLRQEGLETPLNEKRLIDSWAEVMGPAIASLSKPQFIKNQVLYVEVTSAPLRQQLMMGRQQLVIKLNQHVGAQIITNIVFR